MPDAYPYIISNNKIEPILSRIRTAAKPERFTIRECLQKWGFAASNDRAMVSILKELGFLTESGAPTQYYDRLRDPNDWKHVLAERMQDLYSELFAIDSNIQKAPDTEVKGAISRVTGKDDESVKRYFATFKTLAALANFEPKNGRVVSKKDAQEDTVSPVPVKSATEERRSEIGRADFHYNIQIHLPVTTDISVYNAIFKSLRENLGI